MQSTERIIKDIRYCEIKPKDFTGDFNGIIGNVYHVTEDTNSIGQRIARKLNELKFISGEFDHIYINFTENLKFGNLVESEKILDKRIKYVDYGIKPKSLTLLYEKDKEKIEKIIEVDNLLNKFETEIEIAYKTKETNSYKIEIGYIINPKKTLSKIVVKYFDKKTETHYVTTKDLSFYEDLFYLVDRIEVKNGKLIFTHKKTSLGEIATAKYERPIEIEITEMESNHIH
jgi:hypothetical protein